MSSSASSLSACRHEVPGISPLSWADEWVKAWRESEESGKRFNENTLETEKTPSLDRHFAQLRQEAESPSNREKELKKFLKSRGILFGDSLEGTKLYFADEWDKIVEECRKWRAAMENCYIILKNKNHNEPSRQQQDQFYRGQAKDKKGIIAQCQTRFSPEKKKITRWRMEQFSNKMKKGGFRFGLQITLTTDPKRFRNLKEVGNNWKIFMKHFMDFANVRLRRAGKKNTTCYLRACELTESGLLHIHIGFYGPGITGKITKKYANGRTVKDYLFPQKDIRELWDKYGIGKVTWINKAPVDELCDYVTKHVSKSWGGQSNEMLEAFLHYTGMRQWTSSVGAVPKEPPCVEKWELVSVAFTPGEALLSRETLISEGYELIQDDLEDMVKAAS